MSCDCPICGAQNTMMKIPKHRNGIQGRYCGMCKKTIPRGTQYLNFPLPDRSTTPVHLACMAKSTDDDDAS